ncbi:MAG: A/G-specific adenine glycosylase [Bacteroidia bacterium]
MHEKNNKIRLALLTWFSENKRPLPWRETRNPYHIWLSEIILQQTRVAQGLPYYQRFTQQYPAIQQLAAAPEQEVLKLWQGLGYYSRARNLHTTAKIISEKFSGTFPNTYKDLISLKGIGDYTAAAILSIAYNQPYAVLDGNVYRVLSRLFLIETPINAKQAKAIFQQQAQELLDEEQPGNFNEAMMEFGATICVPKNPLCHICPVQAYCEAFALGKVNELPKKLPSKKARNRYLNYLVIRKDGGIYLKERKAGDIWQGLYDFPLVETETDDMLLETDLAGLHIYNLQKMLPVYKTKHQLTHQTLHITFYELEAEIPDDFHIYVPVEMLKDYPVPKPVEFFLQEYFHKKGLF